MARCWAFCWLALPTITGSTAEFALGSSAGVELVFDNTSLNFYGMTGQWLLRERGPEPALANGSGVTLLDSRAHLAKPRIHMLECRDTQDDLEQVRPFITNSFRQVKFQPRSCGARRLRCGRVVLDGVLEEDVLQEAYMHRSSLQHWDGVDVVRWLLAKYFQTGPLVPVGGQLDHNVRADLPCEMHSDYLSRPPHYLLAAIVYLVEQGRECSHCETVFNDAVESGRLSRGHVIQPRRGRVVLFSGGVENMHCKMPSAGRREVVQLWFQCASGTPGGNEQLDL